MLSHPTFNHDTIRKIIIVFGSIFRDIQINRDAANNSVEQLLDVPISYGPKEKFLARAKMNPGLDNEFAMVLPRISFEIEGLRYDASRMGVKTAQVKSGLNSSYAPVPYDMGLQLYVMVKNTVDGTRIVEQILPFFTPSFTIPMTISDIFGVEDVTFVLNHIDTQDSYEADFETRRSQIWTLSFTAKFNIYGPTKTAKLIKMATTNMFVDTAANTYVQAQTYTSQPGLTANGQPTTDINQTIPYIQINATDNWAFINQFDESI